MNISILVSIVFLILGVVLLAYFYPKTRKRVKEITSTQTKEISELKEELMQSEGNRQYTELKGKTLAENLLTAPYSKREVVYYEYEVQRVSDKVDNDGSTSRDETTVANEKSEQNIALTDESTDSSVIVDITEKCTIDIPTTFSEFQPGAGVASFGSVKISLTNTPGTLGYNIKEKTIGANQSLYVLGEAYMDSDKNIHIGKAKEGKRPFIVTTKSEEEYVKTSKTHSIIQLVTGIASIAVGLIALFL